MFNEKEIGLLQKLKGNLKATRQFVKLYASLCSDCKIKVQRNPRMNIEEYCEKCQNRARYRIDRALELLKK